MKKICLTRPKHLIIFTELLSDLGNQFVQLILFDKLIIKGEFVTSNLLVMCALEQIPSVILSPFAGFWIDRIGAKKWLIIINVVKHRDVYLLLITLGHILNLSVSYNLLTFF